MLIASEHGDGVFSQVETSNNWDSRPLAADNNLKAFQDLILRR